MLPPRKVWVLTVAMLVAAGSSMALTPTKRAVATGAVLDLEAVVPKQFAGWQIDPSIQPVVPSPDVQAAIDRIYTHVLTRTYVNGAGQRVMLAVAYGAEQSDALRVHHPEGCYVGQGFQIDKAVRGILKTAYGEIKVKYLIATKGYRKEPITYWIIIGDKSVMGQWEEKVAQLGYGLTGRIPDGLLFRISSIGNDAAEAFAVQEKFARQLLESVDPAYRPRLVGRLDG